MGALLLPDEGRLRRDAECNSAKPHAFVLHGLWPEYEKGWPEDCSIGKRPWVPTSVIDEMRDIMPTMNTGRTAPAPDSTRCNISAWCASFMSA
jgi:ribonuclease I